MVRLVALCCLLWTGIHASESGSWSYKGQRSFEQGHYSQAYGYYRQALRSSRKEADLAAEGRVRVALAVLSTHARAYDLAKVQLDSVRREELDRAGRAALLLAELEWHSAQGLYQAGLEVWTRDSSLVSHKRLGESLRARLYGEAAVIASALGDKALADINLEMAQDLLDGEAPGQLAYIEARMADARKDSSAYSMNQKALAFAVPASRYYVAGSLLLRLGQMAEERADQAVAIDYYERAARVFEELELRSPWLVCAQRLVAIQGDGSPWEKSLKAYAPN